LALRPQASRDGDAGGLQPHGISSATFYKWKSNFGGLEVSETRRLRSLEEENSQLKNLLSEARLDNAVLTRTGPSQRSGIKKW
jgi:putative transposase